MAGRKRRRRGRRRNRRGTGGVSTLVDWSGGIVRSGTRLVLTVETTDVIQDRPFRIQRIDFEFLALNASAAYEGVLVQAGIFGVASADTPKPYQPTVISSPLLIGVVPRRTTLVNPERVFWPVKTPPATSLYFVDAINQEVGEEKKTGMRYLARVVYELGPESFDEKPESFRQQTVGVTLPLGALPGPSCADEGILAQYEMPSSS